MADVISSSNPRTQSPSGFGKFYPYYLAQHQNRLNRRMHFLAGLSVPVMIATFLVTGNWIFLILVPVVAYGFAWVGHFFFERNKPAAFKNPIYGFLGEVRLFREMLSGKRTF